MNPAEWRRLWPYYLAFVLAFPLGMVWAETHTLQGPTVCLFRRTTGLDCPACGLTRAFRAMGRLDAGEAIRYNPLGPVVFFVALIAWGVALGKLCSGGRMRLPRWWARWQMPMLWVGVTLFLLSGVVRFVYELHHPPLP